MAKATRKNSQSRRPSTITVIDPTKGGYVRQRDILVLFGIGREQLHGRERQGQIPAAPRGPDDARYYAIKDVKTWITKGFPPPPSGGVPKAVVPEGQELAAQIMSGAYGPVEPQRNFQPDPDSIDDLAEGRIEPDDDSLGDPDPVEPPIANATGAVQRARARLKRIQDEREAERLNLEADRLEKRMTPESNALVPGDQSLISILLKQNQDLMLAMINGRGAQASQDPLKLAIEIIGAVKGLSTPVDLSDRPEGKVFGVFAEKMADQMSKMMGQASNGGGGGDDDSSGGVNWVKLLEGLLPVILNSTRAVPVGGSPDNGGGPAMPASSPGHHLPGPSRIEQLEDPEAGMDDVRDALVFISNQYAGGVTAVDCATAIVGMGIPQRVLAMWIQLPVTALRATAIGVGDNDFEKIVATPEGKQWVMDVQETLKSALRQAAELQNQSQ